MKVIRADLYRIAIPFQFVFAHAAAERSQSDNVILKLTLSDGTCGYGECLARVYVTGESADDVCEWFSAHGPALLQQCEFTDQDAFTAFIRDSGNALPPHGPGRCLVELALLDAFGRFFQFSVADVFARPQADHRIYAGVLGKMNGFVRRQLLDRMQRGGLKHIKVKVGFGKTDRDILHDCREKLGDDAVIGLDANSAWGRDEALSCLRDMEAFRPDFVEQPLAREDRDGLAWLARVTPVPVVLDESVCTLEEARTAVRESLGHGFSVRISKVGGIANALRIHDVANANGLRYNVGSMVGETGILAAAGRHLATMTNPRFLEGSFGDLLLREDLTEPSVRFGSGGKGPAISGYGLGIAVDQSRIEKHRTWHESFTV